MQNRVKEHRTRLGLTCAALAETAGMSTMEVNRIERGVRRLNETTMRKLASALGVSQQDLLGEVDIPGTEPRRGNVVQDDVERMLLRFWRSLSDERKDFILGNMARWSTETAGRAIDPVVIAATR